MLPCSCGRQHRDGQLLFGCRSGLKVTDLACRQARPGRFNLSSRSICDSPESQGDRSGLLPPVNGPPEMYSVAARSSSTCAPRWTMGTGCVFAGRRLVGRSNRSARP